jgi:cbb3-type cytochrome oxidase maturation protein
MIMLYLLIPLSILVASAFLGAFIWAVRSGQYEDTTTPSMRVLLDEPGETRRRDATTTSNNEDQSQTTP